MDFYFVEYNTSDNNVPEGYTVYVFESGRHSSRDVEDINAFTVEWYWLLSFL